MGRPGYVYVMRLDEHTAPELCAHKIGRSVKPVTRHNQIATLLPYSVSVIHIRQVPDMVAFEAELHARYDGGRLEGEWFRLSLDELAELARIFGATGEGCVCWDWNPACPFYYRCTTQQ